MELRHIRSFLSLAKTLNFSRAAKLVHCGQPALSLQIQALENEIGVKLFERDRGKTVLTAAGTAFQREATGNFLQLPSFRSAYALDRIQHSREQTLVFERRLMRPIATGEALPAGTRLTLFSDDRPDRFFTVIQFWMDETSGVALALRGGVPTYQVEGEKGRTHLRIHLTIEEQNEHRWCLWRPDHAGFDSRSIFDNALIEE